MHLSIGSIVLPWLIAACCGANDADFEYRISAAKEPYFACDSRVVEDRWMLERFVVPAARHAKNPLIVRDREWEETGPSAGGSVLYDPSDKLFKMWYSIWNSNAYYNRLPYSYNICYAESDDGLVWRKPNLGVFSEKGSLENNIIKLGRNKTQNIDVCFNPIPNRVPGKFLAIHNDKGGIFVSSSDDGKTFKFLWEKPAISYHSDTHNNFVYDDQRDEWFLYCRPRAWAGDHKRRVSVQHSKDLQGWTHDRTILIPTETEALEFYGMPVFRRGDVFFGLLQIYDRATGVMNCELAWSGDGVHWDQIPMHRPYLADGPPGSWDDSMVIVTESPVEVGDELWFYYGGHPLSHNTTTGNVGGIGLAISERDRLIGLRPSGKEAGALLTRPFTPAADGTLVVNARVRGKLFAELRTDSGKVIDGYSFADCQPATGSGFALPITWGGKQLGQASKDEIRIAFRFEDAELFTFSVSPPPGKK